MQDFKNNKGIILTDSSSFTGENVILGDNATIDAKKASPSSVDIEKLLAELRRELAASKVSPEDRETIFALADRVQAEAVKEKPNPKLGQITAAGLKEAVASVKDLAPTLLTIATEVARWFAGA
jgi:hypothetical protein